ncbi:Fc.00g031600.m01.CDS01 [Cosmosporella sp. VM-42]
MDLPMAVFDAINPERARMLAGAAAAEAAAPPVFIKKENTPPPPITGANSDPVGDPALRPRAKRSGSLNPVVGTAAQGSDGKGGASASTTSDQHWFKQVLAKQPSYNQSSLKRTGKQNPPVPKKKQKQTPDTTTAPILDPPPAPNQSTKYLESLLRVRPFHLNLEPYDDNKHRDGNGKLLHLQISGVDLLHQQIISRMSGIPVLSFLRSPEVVSTLGDEITYNVTGEILEDVWSSLAPGQKMSIASQLRIIVSNMKKPKITGPAGPIGSTTAGPYSLLIDKHADHTYYAVREHPDQTQFTAFLLSTFYDSVPKIVAAALASRLRNHHNIVLSHGDLSLRNIIVRGDTIVAIIGWGCAGWYPQWWDYAKFFEASTQTENDDWYDYAATIFTTQTPLELALYQGLVRCQRR